MEPIEQAFEFLRARTQTCQLHRLGENHIEELARGIVVNFILSSQNRQRNSELDAALRRAKAEVIEDLRKQLTYSRFSSYEQRMCERGCGLTKEGKIGASIGLAWALGEIDARATLQKGRT